MDIKHGTDFKYQRNKNYENTGNNKYDYAKDGILRRCLPKILFKGNPILVSFLQIIDLRLIMLLKYIDKLKKFKYIAFY